MPRLSYRLVREKLAALGLFPQTRLGRVACYLAGIDLLFYLLEKLFVLLNVLPGTVTTLGAWEEPLLFVVLVLGTILALKWVRLHLMWRLRNRLIVTYVFIGVIPVVLLLCMALMAGYLFVGQFATFVVTDDLNTELNRVAAGNGVVAMQIAGEIAKGVPQATIVEELAEAAKVQELSPEITFFYKGRRTDVNAPAGAAGPAEAPRWVGKSYQGVVYADDKLWLRVAHRSTVKGEPLAVISSVELNKALLERVAGELGQVTLLDVGNIDFVEPGKKATTKDTQVIEVSSLASRRALVGGKLPRQRPRWDTDVVFGARLAVERWTDGWIGQNRPVMSVLTRPSLLYGRLFLTLGDFSRWTVQALIGVAIFFALLELFALFIGVRLTRSMTRSVAELYNATEHINRGHFRHRIQVRSGDQLAALEKSFNSMSESIERLLKEQQEKQRIENELAIAQEVQATLFPRQWGDLATLELHGLCQPARTVSGDYYDFLALGPDALGIAVGDVSGKGISAALLMATIHSAVRAYTLDRRRDSRQVPLLAAAGQRDALFPGPDGDAARYNVAPAELLAMLNRQLFRSTPMEKYATLFFGVYDGSSRTLTYTNAGHLAPIIMGNDGGLRRLHAGGTVAGLFDNVPYEQAAVTLYPGDLFVSFSDGITEPENEYGEFGEERLVELVRKHHDAPLDRVCEAVTTAVRDWIGGAEQPDDITLVLARAR